MGGSWGAMAAAQCASDPRIAACHEPHLRHLFILLAVLGLPVVFMALCKIRNRRALAKTGGAP